MSASKIITALAIGSTYASSIRDEAFSHILSKSNLPLLSQPYQDEPLGKSITSDSSSYATEKIFKSAISSSSPEETVLLLAQIDDPEDFFKALVILNESKSLSSLSIQQKSQILKHTLSIDPLQNYMRELTQPTSLRSISEALRENGSLIFSEELDSGVFEIYISGDLGSILIKSDNEIIILPTIIKEDVSIEFNSTDITKISPISGIIKANKHGLIISLSIAGESPLRGEYWQGKELSYYPESLIPVVERILGSTD